MPKIKHLNDHVFCAVSFRATGEVGGYHDLLEIAIVPLSGIGLDKSILPFNMPLQPLRDNVATRRISNVDMIGYKSARHPNDVASLFEHWFDRLNLSWNKRIIPVGFNLPELQSHLHDLFVVDDDTGKPYLDDYFDFKQARHLETIASYWNDLAWFNDEHARFNKPQPTYIAWRLGHLYEQHASVIQQAMLSAEIFRRFVSTRFREQLPLEMNYPTPVDYSVYEKRLEEQSAFEEE